MPDDHRVNFNPDDPAVRGFFRDLLHRTLHTALGATIWRLPTGVLVCLIAACIAAIVWFGWY
jgi:hypothetical protein